MHVIIGKVLAAVTFAGLALIRRLETSYQRSPWQVTTNRGINKLLAAAMLCVVPVFAHAGAVLSVNEQGMLTGARGILINGEYFGVHFVRGRCSDAYKDCKGFIFGSQVEAMEASKALLNQVFIDSPAGNFDTQPNLTVGCANICNIANPYDGRGAPADEISLPFFFNSWNEYGDYASYFFPPAATYFQYEKDRVWAVWERQCVSTYSPTNLEGVICVRTRNLFALPPGTSDAEIRPGVAYESPSDVPEPATIWLFGFAAVCLIWTCRFKRLADAI